MAMAAAPITHIKGSPVGLCYGRQANHLPTPDQVIKVYHDNRISKMWLRETNESVIPLLKALAYDKARYKIEVILCIENSQLQTFADEETKASEWVNTYIAKYPAVNFSYVCVGDLSYMTHVDSELIVPAMKNISNALEHYERESKKNIKATTIVDVSNLDSYNVWQSPSKCKFQHAYKDLVKEVLSSLNMNSPPTPLFARIIPYFEIDDEDGIDISHYLFTAKVHYMENYKYVYDAMVDSIYCAMDDVGFGKVPIAALSGWPTSGGTKNATFQNAEVYNKNLARHVNEKTPMKHTCMETFVYSLVDEDKITRDEQEWKHFGSFVLWHTQTFPSTH